MPGDISRLNTNNEDGLGFDAPSPLESSLNEMSGLPHEDDVRLLHDYGVAVIDSLGYATTTSRDKHEKGTRTTQVQAPVDMTIDGVTRDAYLFSRTSKKKIRHGEPSSIIGFALRSDPRLDYKDGAHNIEESIFLYPDGALAIVDKSGHTSINDPRDIAHVQQLIREAHIANSTIDRNGRRVLAGTAGVLGATILAFGAMVVTSDSGDDYDGSSNQFNYSVAAPAAPESDGDSDFDYDATSPDDFFDSNSEEGYAEDYHLTPREYDAKGNTLDDKAVGKLGKPFSPLYTGQWRDPKLSYNNIPEYTSYNDPLPDEVKAVRVSDGIRRVYLAGGKEVNGQLCTTVPIVGGVPKGTKLEASENSSFDEELWFDTSTKITVTEKVIKMCSTNSPGNLDGDARFVMFDLVAPDTAKKADKK